ncbi:MAG: MBL fold metallo-hydrolase [candidate division WOR-3 bacterium]
MKIGFYGAAGCVTGSMHMVEIDKKRFLVDAGYFQGDYEEKNTEVPEGIEEIGYIFLTHSHLDHVGRLPVLVKNGFKGEVITHRATWSLVRHILSDAYEVMDKDNPLYSLEDLEKTLQLPVKFVEYNREYEIDDLRFRVKDAGHILGSAFYEFEYKGKRFTFSGDLGNKNKPIIRDPSPPDKTDILICESTYGNRNHKPIKESIEELKKAIFETLPYGKVLIPTFALERAQEILYIFKLWEDNLLWPSEWKVVLDSPLAERILEEFLRFPECYDEEMGEMVKRGNPFKMKNLLITKTVEESKRLNGISTGLVILAGSGMLTGGRAIHHLKHMIEDPNNSLIFVGYQAKGTLGRGILDGEKKVYILGNWYDVNIKIYTINGFSSHAGKDDLVEWIKVANPDVLILVHGEDEARESLRENFKGKTVLLPNLYDEYEF